MTVIGASGSGKTTLLRVVAGLERVDRGRVLIGGRDVTDLGAQQRDIAMVFENDALYPHLTADGNLRFGLKIRHTPKDEIDERVGSESRMLGLRAVAPPAPGDPVGGREAAGGRGPGLQSGGPPCSCSTSR